MSDNISKTNLQLTKEFVATAYLNINKEEKFYPQKRNSGTSQMETIKKMDEARRELKIASASLSLRLKKQVNFIDTTVLLYNQFDQNTSKKILDISDKN